MQQRASRESKRSEWFTARARIRTKRHVSPIANAAPSKTYEVYMHVHVLLVHMHVYSDVCMSCLCVCAYAYV